MNHFTDLADNDRRELEEEVNYDEICEKVASYISVQGMFEVKDKFNYQFEYPKYKSIGRNYKEMHYFDQYHSKAQSP